MQSSATKICVLSILLFFVLLVRVMFYSSKQSNNVQKTVLFIQQSHDVKYQTQKVVSLMYDYERRQLGYNISEISTIKYTKNLKTQLQQHFKQLNNNVKSDSLQVNNLKYFSTLINQRIYISEKQNSLLKNQLLATSDDFLNKLNAASAQIEQEELRRSEAFLQDNNKTIFTINVIFYILGGVVIFLVVAIVVAVQKNVFDRKANTLLHEYSALIDLSHDAIVTTDADSQILQWSKGAETLYGYAKDEVLGKKIGLCTNPVISDEVMAHILKTLDENGSWRGEMVQYNRHGEKLYLDVSYSKILNADGTVKGFSSIRSNITELKTSKKNLQKLNIDLEIEISNKTKEIKEVFERMQKAFLAFDTNWNCTYANQPILYYLNANKDEIIGKNFRSFFEGITDTNFYQACLRAMELQETQELREYVPFFNCWFESSIYPSLNGVSIYISDITDQKKIEQEIISQKRQLRNLTNHIQNLREEERKIIARELHDDLGQIATVLKIDIKSIKNNLPEDKTILMSKVDYTLESVDELIKKIRKISHQLRPPLLDNLGVQAALKSYCQDYERKFGILCEFAQNLPDKRLNQDVETALFRICQESLTNVARHAKATQVNVSLMQSKDFITLTVKDNGSGFDINATGNTLGIIGIKERAANINYNLEIETILGVGTSIVVSGLIKDLPS